MEYISNLEELIIKDFTVLYFYADWLNFHKKMTIMIEKVEESKEFNFLAIDIDDFKPLCRKYKIESIPTVVAFYKGKEVGRLVGITLTSAFKTFFREIYIKCKGESNEESK